MNPRVITKNNWSRVFIESGDERELAISEAVERLAAGSTLETLVFELRFVTPLITGPRVTDTTVVLGERELVTVEHSNDVSLMQDVAARLTWQGDRDRSPVELGGEIVRGAFAASADCLTMLEADIRLVRSEVTSFQVQNGKPRGLSVSDLPRVSELLIDIEAVLSQVSYSIHRLTQFARSLRRMKAEDQTNARVGDVDLEALIVQGEALTERTEFLVERHRFHSRGTAEQISTSDLNIVKIFTVLWAILIPGSTLINWYGQNFEFMPELSWYFSSWVQIAAVFLLAVIPIYTVKRAGQLR